jgi:hypothetical protein
VDRRPQDLPDGPLFDDDAVPHDGDAIGHLRDDAEVMRNEQQRQVVTDAELA